MLCRDRVKNKKSSGNSYIRKLTGRGKPKKMSHMSRLFRTSDKAPSKLSESLHTMETLAGIDSEYDELDSAYNSQEEKNPFDTSSSSSGLRSDDSSDDDLDYSDQCEKPTLTRSRDRLYGGNFVANSAADLVKARAIRNSLNKRPVRIPLGSINSASSSTSSTALSSYGLSNNEEFGVVIVEKLPSPTHRHVNCAKSNDSKKNLFR